MCGRPRLCETAALAVRVGAITTILVGFLLLGPLAANLLAAPTWLSPHELSGVEATHPRVALDSQGDAVVVWERDNETGIIEASDRLVGGAWGEPVELSAAGHRAEEPQVALDSQGDATAVWWRNNGVKNVIEAAGRPVAGTWQAPEELSAADQDAGEPQIAVDPQGDAVAIWTNGIIEAASRPSGGSWQAPVELSAPEDFATSPKIALNPKGDAVAVWRRYTGASWIIEAASRPAGGSWQAPVELSAAAHEGMKAQVALNSQGDAVVVWERFNGANEIIEAASRPAGGSWQAPVELSAAGHNASSPQIAVDPEGDAVVVWERDNGANEVIEAASRPAGGGWQEPVELSAADHSAFSPQIALNTHGNAMAVWWRYSEGGADQTIEAASRPAGGSWQAPVEISAADRGARDPHVALDPQDNAVAVWEREIGGNWIIEGAGYDASGPLLRSLSIPSTGVTDQQLEFSVSPLDVWSALGATDWRFGDGSSAGGTSATHTYTTPGSYSVTLTSADALGNTTSAGSTVSISSAPPAPLHHKGAHGTASVARLAQVKKGNALLMLACKGAGPCQGVVKLIIRMTHKRQMLGKAAFSIPPGEHRVVWVKLRKHGKALILSADRRGLKVKLMGSEIRGHTVVLKEAGAR